MQRSLRDRPRACIVFFTLVVLGAWPSSTQTRSQGATPAAEAWWKTEPIRFLQTNLSETNSTTDPDELVAAVGDFGANTFLVNMGGIVAQYPTRIPFHYASAFLPPGRDLFGDVLRVAHARRIRVIGRFDLSKTQKPVFDAHPEWFFKRSNGEPAIYNGLYSTCINGNYYREHALTILAEALDRYEVDGLFFNMFGNPTADYSGVPMGPCQCDACQARYRARYRRDVPATADADYRTFMSDSSREVAATIAELIHRKRPRAAFLTYIKDHTDGIMSESNTAVGRALPLWPYSASDNVGRSLGSEPDKLAINLSMNFVDFPWRYASVPQPEIQLRLYQNMAHGGPPAVAVVGTMRQEDRQGLAAAKPIFQWHARHEDLYVGQKNAGRVPPAGDGRHRRFPRVLPPAERAAHPVCRLREPPVDGRRVATVRSRDRPRPCARGSRTIRARWRAPAGGGDHATRAAHRPCGRPPDHAGLLARARPRRPSFATRHEPALRRRRLRGADADRASSPHAGSGGDVRSPRKSMERQGRDESARARLRRPRKGTASATFPGTSARSTTGTARRAMRRSWRT